MIRHIVFFEMKDCPEKERNTVQLAAHFQRISKQIPGVLSVETGQNYNCEKQFYGLCLNQSFESREALETYLIHPLHLQVREFVFQVIDHRIVVDYDL